MMASTAMLRIGQRVRIIAGTNIIAREGAQPDGSLGTIVATLTISPGYYAVCLDSTATRCVVFETNLEALPAERQEDVRERAWRAHARAWRGSAGLR